jgi:hypothetical protein
MRLVRSPKDRKVVSNKLIFFTSKVVDLFRISANGFRLTIDNERDDSALGTSNVSVGSVVELKLGLPPREDASVCLRRVHG